MIKQFIKKLIQYYIDLIVSWYRQIKTYFNLNYEIKKYHDSFDQPLSPNLPTSFITGFLGLSKLS